MKKNKTTSVINSDIIKPNPPEKKWFEKPIGITLLAVLSGVIVVYVAYYFGWNAPKENKQQTQEQKPLPPSSSNIPRKTPSGALLSNKSGKNISQPTINVPNSNIFIGQNSGTVNQNIYHKPPTRHFTQEQHDILLNALRPYSGTSIDIISVGDTNEANNYAAEIEGTLSEAGISLRKSKIHMLIPPAYGLTISPTDRFLLDAFTAAHIDFQTDALPIPGSHGLLIGTNPAD